MTSTAVLLVLSSCATAVVHALIPDHWLPFVLLARSQRWGDRRITLLTGLAGLLHVMMSVIAGALAIAMGATSARGLAERVGRSLEFLSGLLLVLFGVAYGVWAHRREARVHGHPGESAAGEGGLHAHGHLLERWFRGAITGGALVVVIGMSPCALLAPILFAASAEGTAVIALAALGFASCTIGTMVGITLFASRGMRRLDLPFFTRYGDLISGVLIAVIGFVLMALEA